MTGSVSERRTARLRLRRVTEADVASVVALSIDPRTHRHSPTGAPTRAQAEAIAAARGHTPEWPVVVRTRPRNEAAARLARAIGLQRRPDLDADGFITFAG